MNARPQPPNQRLPQLLMSFALLFVVSAVPCQNVLAREEASSELRFTPPQGKLPVPKGTDVLMLSDGSYRAGYRIMKVSATDERGNRTSTDDTSVK